MKINNFELTIYVGGRPITEYSHEAQTFVEGRTGSEYEIELHNHTYGRVEAVISVDGLSVIDGKPAGTQSQGYLIEARNSIRIPGWKLDAASVAKFAFSNMAKSYTTQSGGDARNNGVIGAMVFSEKIAQPYYGYGHLGITAASASPLRGRADNISVNNTSIGSLESSGWLSMNAQSMDSYSSTVSDSASRGIAPSGITTNSASMSQSSTSSMPPPKKLLDIQPQNLGTAFGESAEFKTRTVSFERLGQIATLLCYYDSKGGLKARGIKIERRRKPAKAPQAFPANPGCQPPPGWEG